MFTTHLGVLFLGLTVRTCAGLSTGTFTWPESTVQCGVSDESPLTSAVTDQVDIQFNNL